MSKLESLRDEVTSTSSSTKGDQSTGVKEEVNDVWTSLIDVCDRYQVHLASLIADRALKPEVAKTLSDIADQLMEQKEPKEVLEIMLGGSAGKFFQSPHVPDWTLEILVFVGEKSENREENPRSKQFKEQRQSPKNLLHHARISKPEPHWWDPSALTATAKRALRVTFMPLSIQLLKHTLLSLYCSRVCPGPRLLCACRWTGPPVLQSSSGRMFRLALMPGS